MQKWGKTIRGIKWFGNTNVSNIKFTYRVIVNLSFESFEWMNSAFIQTPVKNTVDTFKWKKDQQALGASPVWTQGVAESLVLRWTEKKKWVLRKSRLYFKKFWIPNWPFASSGKYSGCDIPTSYYCHRGYVAFKKAVCAACLTFSSHPAEQCTAKHFNKRKQSNLLRTRYYLLPVREHLAEKKIINKTTTAGMACTANNRPKYKLQMTKFKWPSLHKFRADATSCWLWS